MYLLARYLGREYDRRSAVRPYDSYSERDGKEHADSTANENIPLRIAIATMVENKKDESKCPVNEWVRHGFYIGGMVALHSGLCASATVAHKTDKCPVSEWSRHFVYVGGLVALAAKAYGCSLMTCPMIKDKEEDAENKECSGCSKCPVSEWARHAIYVAGMVGIVAMINSRKK